MSDNSWITEEQLRRLFTGRRKDLYGEWLVESEEERHLRELAEMYHAGCEAYDQRVCTGRHPKTGEAIPITSHEFGLVNRHARAALEGVIREGERLGLAPEQVLQAIRNYHK